MKRKAPRVITIHIVPSKKLTPDMEKAEIYNKMMAEKIMKESKACIDYWRKEVARQDMIKEMLLNDEANYTRS